MKTKIIILLLCLSIPLFWCTRHYVLFDKFKISGNPGGMLAKTAMQNYTDEEILKLVNEGVISPFCLIKPHKGYWQYDRLKWHIYKQNEEMFYKYMAGLGLINTGIPILDMHVCPDKSGNNWNKIDFLFINDVYFNDAMVLIGLHPMRYMRSIAKAVKLYMMPGNTFFVRHGYRNKVSPNSDEYISFYNETLNSIYIKTIIFTLSVCYGLCVIIKRK